MACSKYTLTNIGTFPVNFNYRRCDDSMWEYQVNLDPNETKNIWLINGTYQTSQLFENVIELGDDGVFPLTPTPTPSITPTNTPSPTPTNTETPTPTPTNTETPTPTPTNTETPTPTPTPQLVYSYIGLGYSFSSNTDACSGLTIDNFYGFAPNFSSLLLGDIIYQEIQAINPIGEFYLSDGTNYIQTDINGEIVVGLTPC